MPLPLVPIVAGKALVAAGITLYGHRFAQMLQTPNHYAAQEPAFVPHALLSGPWRVEGLAHGPFGRVAARVTGEMDGEWIGSHGWLHFRLADENGEEWAHVLTGAVEGDDRIKLTGSTLPSSAEGVLSGNSLRLRYTLRLPDSLGGWNLEAEDWLFAMPSGNIAYHGQYHKLGFPAGSFSGFLTRQAKV